MKARKLVKWMVKRAIALGGTCTGEHGVGIGKREYLCEELGYGTVELMKKIKRTIDPLNLFNPGKVSVNSSPCSDQLCSTRTGVPGFIAKRCLGELIVRPMMPPIGVLGLLGPCCTPTLEDPDSGPPQTVQLETWNPFAEGQSPRLLA